MRYAFLLSLFISFGAKGDTLSLIKSIPVQSHILRVDEMGNAYIVRNGNTLIRFTPEGDSSAFYRGVQNGIIEGVDVTNPLRIVVYYPRQSKVVLLDRMLTEKGQIDLRQQGIAQVPVVASSADGSLWIYDLFNAKLKKIDEQGRITAQSNDLRLETEGVITPSFLVERDWKLYMVDTVSGIYTYDRYGSYISTLSLYPKKTMQLIDNQIIWYEANALHSWDTRSMKMQTLPLPKGEAQVVDAAINGNIVYALYTDSLVLYRRQVK